MARRTDSDYDYSLPFHVGARCINRDWFGIPMADVWTLMNRHLYLVSEGYGARIMSFVLMANHFHLLARFPGGNLSEAMAYFLRETSRELRFTSRRINHTYSSRFFRSSLVSPLYYLHCYKYVYRNPVETGLVSAVEAYPWSTLHGLLGRSRVLVPMAEDEVLTNDVEGTLSWLNRAPEAKHREAVRWAMARKTFRLPKDRNSRRPHILETNQF